MHLKRIELTNYRQHKKLDIDFSGNLIAVLGKNGVGKSNFIGAIQFALTGEQPGFTKADLTTWGEKEGSVRLFFSAGPKDEDFVITRKTSGDVSLKIGDETIKQTRKVEEALREKAGLDKELIKQIVFVPQKGIDAILFDDPKNREVAFQRLIGIGNAAKIYETLRTEISLYDKPQGLDEAIASERKQCAELKDILAINEVALQNYETTISKIASKDGLEKWVKESGSADVCISNFIDANQRLTKAQKEFEEKMLQLSNFGVVSESEEEELRNKVDFLSTSLTYLTRLKELASEAMNARECYSLAKGRLEDITKKFETSLDDDKMEVDRLSSAQVAAESELRSLKALERDANSDGTCPLCGAKATQEDIHSHLSERITDATQKAELAINAAKTARMAYDAREAEESVARNEFEKRKHALDIAIANLQKAKDKNAPGVTIDVDTFAVSYKGIIPDDIESIQKKYDDLSKKLSDSVNKRQNAKSIRDSVSKLSAEIDLLSNTKREYAEKLASIGINHETVKSGDQEKYKKAYETARAQLDAYNGILMDMSRQKGKCESIEISIKQSLEAIKELEEKKKIEDAVKEKIDTVKRVRDWFHYREGPRIMSQNVMRDLTACVNNYLDQFCAPFVVEAEEEGFGFRCNFIDGRNMPDPHPDASLLSGGQKVALAIAFRMAIYMCFGGELGLLSLDEPTAYLDDASIEHLGELLEKVGAVARNKGLQILMATHEKAIMPFLDTKIDLDQIKGE